MHFFSSENQIMKADAKRMWIYSCEIYSNLMRALKFTELFRNEAENINH